MYSLQARDSFNRFNNDLMPLLLSYLPISECFRLEGVWKRFKQNAFNSQTKLIIEDRPYKIQYRNSLNSLLHIRTKINAPKHINNEALNYVLTECQNINDLTIDTYLCITDETLNVLRNRCQRLKRLTIHIRGDNNNASLECWQQLFANGLQNLESLSLFCSEDEDKYLEIITTLVPIHKLKSLNLNYDEYIYDECFEQHMQHLFYNIESVNRYVIRDEKFIRFTDYFSHQIKSLAVSIDSAVSIDILEHLARFANIQYVRYAFFIARDLRDKKYIQMLKMIGVKCDKLKVLEIRYLNAPFYVSFGNGFKSLKKLVIKDKSHYSENIALLKNCANLKYLIFEGTKITCRDFNDIHLHLPQLRAIDIILVNYSDVKKKLLSHLALLPNLCDLKISYTKNFDNLISFIEKSSSIRRICLYNNLSANEENEIQEYMTNNYPKIMITMDNVLH